MEKRKCPECGEPISGRTDKKFCSDLCRNSFNNKQNSDSTNYIRNINNILRKNRRILEDHLEGEKTTVSRQKLIDKGFNFAYCTNVKTTNNNHKYTYCYEFGYLPIEEKDLILIVKRKAE
ncbi:MAG: DUF2116 family Zn-ribbon domain-containing protein [Bacteroidia bacterium]|nr:DUF2116 family Zn-ribbon domain-containing protein [Bacteroidia bacterium]